MTSEGTIREVLVPALEAAFPNRGLRVGKAPGFVVVFAAAPAAVGDLFVAVRRQSHSADGSNP